jgi:nucleoside-diphosphate-sugar epimerase
MASEARALVFGASGITGWAIMKNLLTKPTPTTWQRVVGLTNRPFSKESAGLPDDSRVEIYSGLDLSNGEEVKKQLMNIPSIDNVCS